MTPIRESRELDWTGEHMTPNKAKTDNQTATAAPEAPTYIEGDGTKMQLYVRSMGKLLAVTALFDSDDKANQYCERHNDEGVVATGGGLVMVANLYDHGTRAELPSTNDRTKLYITENS